MPGSAVARVARYPGYDNQLRTRAALVAKCYVRRRTAELNVVDALREVVDADGLQESADKLHVEITGHDGR